MRRCTTKSKLTGPNVSGVPGEFSSSKNETGMNPRRDQRILLKLRIRLLTEATVFILMTCEE
jgi:hypothetical protein